MECCQCQQERQKYLKQICGESRGATPWDKGHGHRPTGQAASPLSLLSQPTPAQWIFEAEGGNSSNAAGGCAVLSFQHGPFLKRFEIPGSGHCPEAASWGQLQAGAAGAAARLTAFPPLPAEQSLLLLIAHPDSAGSCQTLAELLRPQQVEVSQNPLHFRQPQDRYRVTALQLVTAQGAAASPLGQPAAHSRPRCSGTAPVQPWHARLPAGWKLPLPPSKHHSPAPGGLHLLQNKGPPGALAGTLHPPHSARDTRHPQTLKRVLLQADPAAPRGIPPSVPQADPAAP